jgi:energy-coupling factor transporter ATP-binding protein EcfA2
MGARTLRLIPRPPEIGPNDGFVPENDIFGYKDFGVKLTNLICSHEGSLVVALDGPWGSGKSTFIKQWTGHLRNNQVPVVVFDTFASDYQEDPFIALVAEINAFSEEVLKTEKEHLTKFTGVATKVGKALLPVAAKVAFRATTLGLANASDFDGVGDSFKEAVSDVADKVGSFGEAYIRQRLTESHAERDATLQFRETLSQLSKAISDQIQSGDDESEAIDCEDGSGKRTPPLVVIVDELDRCRPDFAVKTLERVKHLFAVDNVCFLMVGHFGQVEAAVRGLYGNETNAKLYLEKFYDIRANLPEMNISGDNRRKKYIKYLWDQLKLKTSDHFYNNDMVDLLDLFSEKFSIELRSIEKIISNIAIFLSAANERTFRVVPIAVGLAIMRHVSPNKFSKVTRGRLTWPEAEKLFLLDEKSEDYDFVFFGRWWQFCTASELPDVDWVRELQSITTNFRDRRDIPKLLAGRIDGIHISPDR